VDTNSIIEIVKKGAAFLQPAIPGVVGALLTTLFLRKNTGAVEFEKIKAGKFEEAIDQLLESGKMTYFEFYKCRNFLHIARLADQYQEERKQSADGGDNPFDFDWFIRFFDAAGNISNEKMQELWAKVFAGEIQNSGAFSLRALDTLKNMNQKEAELFQRIAHLVLTEQNGLKFVLSMSGDLGKDINEQYGLSRNDFAILEECGIVNSLRSDSRITLKSKLCGIWNDNIIIIFKYKQTDGVLNSYKYSSYTLTQSACQLLSIVDTTPNDEYLLDIGVEHMKKYSGNLLITAHPITDSNFDSFSYDESTNLLRGKNIIDVPERK